MNNETGKTFTTSQLIDDFYRMQVNCHLKLEVGFARLFIKTYQLLDEIEGTWQFAPEEKWFLLATISSEKIVMHPIHLYPLALRYLESKNGRFIALTYIDGRGHALPDNAEAAVAQIESRLDKNIFDPVARGLGLSKELAPLWEAFFDLGEYTHLVIGNELQEYSKDNMVFIDIKDVNELRRTFNRITRKGRVYLRRTKLGVVHDEVLAKIDPERFQRTVPVSLPLVEVQREGVRQAAIRERAERYRSVKTVHEQLKQIVTEAPHELMRLHAEIERVTLAKMIETFKEKLASELNEKHWQAFFEQNKFILSMVFARPVELICTQFHAKASELDGTGALIGDFLFKEHGQTLAIIELKKPGTNLLHGSAYRGQNVFGPSSDLSGAITQVLFQQSELRKNWQSRSNGNKSLSSSGSDVIKCIVIVGRLPVDENKLRSFEIFRNAYKDVEIVTFDELLIKLEILEKQLAPVPDIPF